MKQIAYLFIGLIGIALTTAHAQQATDDFPTLDRVEYVIGCMKLQGGESYDSMYACVCAIDYIRSQFSYQEYAQAQTYTMLRGTPGEKGGVFRDPDQADSLRDRLKDAEATIQQRCFFKALKAD